MTDSNSYFWDENYIFNGVIDGTLKLALKSQLWDQFTYDRMTEAHWHTMLADIGTMLPVNRAFGYGPHRLIIRDNTNQKRKCLRVILRTYPDKLHHINEWLTHRYQMDIYYNHDGVMPTVDSHWDMSNEECIARNHHHVICMFHALAMVWGRHFADADCAHLLSELYPNGGWSDPKTINIYSHNPGDGSGLGYGHVAIVDELSDSSS